MNAAENALYCIIQQRCIKTVSNLQVGNIVQVMSHKTFQGLYIPIIYPYMDLEYIWPGLMSLQ